MTLSGVIEQMLPIPSTTLNNETPLTIATKVNRSVHLNS